MRKIIENIFIKSEDLIEFTVYDGYINRLIHNPNNLPVATHTVRSYLKEELQNEIKSKYIVIDDEVSIVVSGLDMNNFKYFAKVKFFKNEEELCMIAEQHPEDNIANKAMKILRKNYDSGYIWCQDCDGLVTKEEDCCLNQNIINNNEITF